MKKDRELIELTGARGANKEDRQSLHDLNPILGTSFYPRIHFGFCFG
jgi:hypothetical protein